MGQGGLREVPFIPETLKNWDTRCIPHSCYNTSRHKWLCVCLCVHALINLQSSLCVCLCVFVCFLLAWTRVNSSQKLASLALFCHMQLGVTAASPSSNEMRMESPSWTVMMEDNKLQPFPAQAQFFTDELPPIKTQANKGGNPARQSSLCRPLSPIINKN